MRNLEGVMADMNYFREKSRCSDCHSHEQAGMDSRVCHFHPIMSTRMKPSMCGARNLQLPYGYAAHGYSSPDIGSFKEQKCHHDPASNFRVWPTPSQFNVANYDNHECLSWRSGMFHNGGSSPLVEPSNSNVMFSPMLNERITMFGGDATASSSRYNIYSRSPAPVTGACTPATPLHRNLLPECQGVYVEESQSIRKQVTLHKWFLIRAPNNVSTTNNMKYIEVCLGGLVRFGPQYSQLVRTSVVAERLEKCKLRTLNGTEIHLVGYMDEHKTTANGFSVMVKNLFLTGFPGNWRRLVTESSAMAPPHGVKAGSPIEFDNCEFLSNGKSENVDSAFTRSVGTTGYKVSQTRNIPPVLCSNPCPEISREEQERADRQRGFGDGISKLYSNDVQGAELDYTDNTKRKEEGHVSSCPLNYMDPKSLSELYDGDLPLNLKRKLDESSGHVVNGEVNYRAGSSELVTDNDATCHVVCDVDNGTLLDVTASPLPNGCHTFDESQDRSHKNGTIATGKSLNPTNVYAGVGCNSDTNIEHDVQVVDLVFKTDHPPCTQLQNCVATVCEIHTDASSLTELKGKGNSVEVNPVLSDVNFVSHDASKARDCSSKPKLRYSKRLRKEDPGCEEGIKLVDQNPDLGQRVSKRTKFCSKASKTDIKPIEEECSILSNRVLAKGQDDCVDRSKAMHLQKSVNHQTKTSKVSTKHARVQVSEPFGPPRDYEAGHHHEGHIDTAASTREVDKASRFQEVLCLPVKPVRSPKMRRHARYDRNSSKQIQAQSKSTTKTCHYKSSILPPPLPPPRVNVSKDQIMRAYGLKMSRSGRLLVPPLAYWRNQTLAHDMDGTIIAIWEGFVEHPADTGCYNFKPPVEKTAVYLQEELCAAATVISNRSKKKKR